MSAYRVVQVSDLHLGAGHGHHHDNWQLVAAWIEREKPDLVVVNGDLITQCDVGDLLDFHDQGGYVATLGVRPYTVEVPFGVVEVDGGRVVALREKPTERTLINAGIYVLSPESVARVPHGTEYPITTLFETLLAEGRPVGARVLESEWLDVGRHDELRRARGVL